MPNKDAIDPSQVKWDSPPVISAEDAGSIDPSQVQWDTPVPKQTATGAIQAAGSGLTSGIADVAGLPVDTGRRAVELGKAAAGTAYGELTKKNTTPANEAITDDGRATRTTHGLYHYVDPTTGADTFSKNPPPPGSHPFTHQQISIPSFLQPNTQPDIGSSQNIKSGIRSVLGDDAVDTQEQTPTNRIIHSGAEAAPFAVTAPEAPIAGAVSAIAGGTASQYAAENGASPWQQTAIGMLAGSVPAAGAGAAAATRGLVRGGAEGRAAMEARLADAKNANNTPLTLGQASGSGTAQYAEGLLSKLPGGGDLKTIQGAQTNALGDHIGTIVNHLSGDSKPSPMTAGTAIETGVKSTKQTMKDAEEAADQKQDSLIPEGHQADVSGVLRVLNNHASTVPGAEAITSVVSPKIKALRDQVQQAVDNNTDPSTLGSVGGKKPPTIPTLPYDAVAALKTKVGNMIDWGFAPANPMENGQLKDLWGSLADAKTNSAMKAGPEAAKAAADFNKLYSTNQATRSDLNRVIDVNGGPEAVYQAATNKTKAGATKINTVMSALQPEQQNLVRATVLDKLGKTSGAQDADFNANTFLTNWKKLDGSAKDALFGASGTPKDLRDSLDNFTRVMQTIKSGTKLENPSGSGSVVGHAAGYGAALDGLKDYFMHGDLNTLGWTAAGLAGNKIASHMMTNPAVLNWFTRTTKAPISALPNAVNQLDQMGKKDPDARDLADYFRSFENQQPAIARATGGKVDIDSLVDRLVKKWKTAKKETDNTTKPLLKVPDSIIVRALDIAQEHL